MRPFNMLRLGNTSGADAEEERRAADAAVVGTTLTYLLVCAAIHVSPFFLEQLGFEVTK